MSFFRELFSRPVTSKDLQGKLQDVEKSRRRTMLELRKLGAKQTELVEQIKRERKNGNAIEVDYIWEDLRAIKSEVALLRKEGRILNLEGIALKRYIRGLERLEKSGDRESARKLMDRIKNSGLDARLAAADVDDKEYLSELQATLDDAGLQDDSWEEFADDPEKLKFLAQIDEINAAEDAGDLEHALEKESQLKTELEKEGEHA
ncbi:MAG: hypothetical protein AB7K09_05255 [Planctomycetota bacterium]